MCQLFWGVSLRSRGVTHYVRQGEVSGRAPSHSIHSSVLPMHAALEVLAVRQDCRAW